MALKSIDMLMKDFEIPFIIDNDSNKAGESYNGIPIITLEEARDKIENYKIVISSTYGVYKTIAEILEKLGLKENENYCILDVFVAEWYWYNKKDVHLMEVHTTITEKCTFNCKNCNMFMPYFQEPKHIARKEIINDIDDFFKIVDKVIAFKLLGGEPFLHSQLDEILEYICDNYDDR